MLVGNVCVLATMDASLDGATGPAGDAGSDDAGAGAAGLGAACGPPAVPCADPAFPSCQTAPSGERYCTSTGCTSTSDCMGDYQCVTSASPSYCRRPYRGQGVPCQTSATCTQDAKFCSSLRRVCMVQDCTCSGGFSAAALCTSDAADSCDPGYDCFQAGNFMPGVPNVCVASGEFAR